MIIHSPLLANFIKAIMIGVKRGVGRCTNAAPAARPSVDTPGLQMRAFKLMRGRYRGGVNGSLTPLFDARLSEIDQRRAKRVRCVTGYTSVRRWPAWMEIGENVGEIGATGQGLCGAKMTGLPKDWNAAATKHRPELLAGTAKLLEPIWREA